MRKTICFAYYGDGHFIGWYSDSFGSITKNSPKLYGESEEQIEIVAKNFRYKIEQLHKDADWKLNNPVGEALLNAGQNADKRDLRQYKQVELRVVECPEYDGANPDYDKADFKSWSEKRRQKLEETEIPLLPSPSPERTFAMKIFDQVYGEYPVKSWIYADYTKVKEWAAQEPTKFLKTINS